MSIHPRYRAARKSLKVCLVETPVAEWNYKLHVHVNKDGIDVGCMTVPWDEIDEARASLKDKRP